MKPIIKKRLKDKSEFKFCSIPKQMFHSFKTQTNTDNFLLNDLISFQEISDFTIDF